MSYKKEVLTAAATLSCAIGVGFIMQNGDSAHERYGSKAQIAAPQQASLIAPAEPARAAANDSLLDVHGITLTSAEVDPVVIRPNHDSVIATAASPMSNLETPADPEAFHADACAIEMTVTPAAAAMVDLSLKAPCLPGERVTVHHNGLMFTKMTSDTGTLETSVPALTEDAVFILTFSNGEGAVAQTHVDSLPLYVRVVLQWKGDAGFQLHAREFGAAYGEQGDVWAGAPRDLSAVTDGLGGFMTRYEEDGTSDALVAEVYSFPKSLSNGADTIDLTVEAEVTAENCGLEIEAKVLQLDALGGIMTQDVSLAVPECGAIGEFLVLNNLLQDLKVASR